MARHSAYVSALVVSFFRSHFISVDLIVQCELVEAGTILRKQIELASRLNELASNSDLTSLSGRTPNVRHLRYALLRRQYDEYSAIAHSSKPEQLHLLGSMTHDDERFYPFYPVFDRNAVVALRHMCLIALEFARWAEEQFPKAFTDFDLETHIRSTDDLSELLECFDDSGSEPHGPPASPPEAVIGRATFLALASLLHFKRQHLAAVAAQTQTPLQGLPSPMLRDELEVAYLHGSACVSFLANAVNGDLSQATSVEQAIKDWLALAGVNTPLGEIEEFAATELNKPPYSGDGETSAPRQAIASDMGAGNMFHAERSPGGG